jgi:hypothetical protein
LRNSWDFKATSVGTSTGRPEGKTEWLVWLIQIAEATRPNW